MRLTGHIPNFFTSLNLLFGCVGIVFATSGKLDLVPYCVWLSAIFDFFDGFAARLLKVKSEIGKQFDSLADMVTFGVLPSFVIYHLLNQSLDGLLPYLSFLLAIFSALRLAKFNVDKTQREVFIGMPTPAVAILITGLIFLLRTSIAVFIVQPAILILLVVFFSWLMVSPLKFIALKFSHYQWNGNELKIVVLVGSVILLTVWGFYATPFVILWYILISIIGNLLSKI